MHIRRTFALSLLLSAAGAFAAPPQYLIIDHSSEVVMEKTAAMAVWNARLDAKMTARLNKLYPVSKWGFISQVEGGFTDQNACVVTARVIMVPRITGSRLVFKPNKTATTFATQAGATREQCREMARGKLEEAIAAVGSSLITP